MVKIFKISSKTKLI